MIERGLINSQQMIVSHSQIVHDMKIMKIDTVKSPYRIDTPAAHLIDSERASLAMSTERAEALLLASRAAC